MKIQNQYKVSQSDSVSKSGKKKSVQGTERAQAEPTTQVELSESAGFVQGLREMAEGIDPQEVRLDVVEASREDLRKGLLGSDQDYEQTINALLTESNDFED